MMRKIRYLVAMSLDGFIAGPNGEADWIGVDPEVDFPAIWAQFDTGLMGRKTYEAAVCRLGEEAFAEIKIIVFSRTMKPQDHPNVSVIPELNADWVRTLKTAAGKDIWLFGGSELFRTFLDAGCIDTVEVTIIPVMLGIGVPLMGPPYHPSRMKLFNSKIYRSGRISLSYEIQH
jgi:dihydrofolate reductase